MGFDATQDTHEVRCYRYARSTALLKCRGSESDTDHNLLQSGELKADRWLSGRKQREMAPGCAAKAELVFIALAIALRAQGRNAEARDILVRVQIFNS